MTSTQRQGQIYMYFLVNASPLKPLDVRQILQLHMLRDVEGFARQGQIMYFLINAFPPETLGT